MPVICISEHHDRRKQCLRWSHSPSERSRVQCFRQELRDNLELALAPTIRGMKASLVDSNGIRNLEFLESLRLSYVFQFCFKGVTSHNSPHGYRKERSEAFSHTQKVRQAPCMCESSWQLLRASAFPQSADPFVGLQGLGGASNASLPRHGNPGSQQILAIESMKERPKGGRPASHLRDRPLLSCLNYRAPADSTCFLFSRSPVDLISLTHASTSPS